MSDMVWGFVPGGQPKDLGRKVKGVARFAVGMAGVATILAVSVVPVVYKFGASAVLNAVTKKGGRD